MSDGGFFMGPLVQRALSRLSPALEAALRNVHHTYVLPEPTGYLTVDADSRFRFRVGKPEGFAIELYTRQQVVEMLDAAYGRKSNVQGT